MLTFQQLFFHFCPESDNVKYVFSADSFPKIIEDMLNLKPDEYSFKFVTYDVEFREGWYYVQRGEALTDFECEIKLTVELEGTDAVTKLFLYRIDQ